MIRINLLPKELQSAARTPMVLFVTVVGGLALSLLALFVFGYMWFNVIVLDERLERKRAEVLQLQKNAGEVDSLLLDIADYKEREKAIISIKTNRILWSRKLDELAELSPPFIWIVRMEMRELDPSEYRWAKNEQQTGGYVKLSCYSMGSDVDRMTFFRSRLKSAGGFYLDFVEESIKPESFYSDFINVSRPEWRVVQLPGYREVDNIRFTVQLDLRPLHDRKAEA